MSVQSSLLHSRLLSAIRIHEVHSMDPVFRSKYTPRFGAQALSFSYRPALSPTTTILPSRRQMSTSSPPPGVEFLIQVPDYPNASANRARAREAHGRDAQRMVDSGHLTLGSVLVREHSREGEKPVIVGSLMIVKAESEEAVRELLEEDAYAKEGAWDVKNAQIWPIETAFRTVL